MEETVFIDGLIAKKTSVHFVKAKLHIKVDELTAFLQKHKDDTGWVNINIQESKAGNLYAKLDTWKPEANQNPVKEAVDRMDKVEPIIPEKPKKQEIAPNLGFEDEEESDLPF